MMTTNRLLLVVHLLAVVAFSSNVVGAWFWQRRAARARDGRVVAFAFATLNASDLWITPASSVAIAASGVALAVESGTPLLATGWLFWSMVAFALSGLLFLAGALPAQRRLARWTAAEQESLDWERYDRESRHWERWAHASLGLAMLVLVLMLVKPSLPVP